MRKFSETLDRRMFDFAPFYQLMASHLRSGCTIAEVGVAEGASAIYLAEELLNRDKSFTFYFIDDLSYGHDYQLRSLMKNVGKANLGQYIEIIPVSSVEAACRFPDLHFDFVFIDASHKIEWTKADILLWYQKVKRGGILAGHDYNSNEGVEVKMAVDQMIPNKAFDDMGMRRKCVDVIATEKGMNVWKITKSPHLKIQTS